MRYRFLSWAAGLTIVYRWSTLVAGLLIALFAQARPGDERLVLLAPVVAAMVISLTHSTRLAGGWLVAGLVIELVVAGAALWITGHHDSPLVLYMTAPAVHAAVIGERRLCAGLVGLSIGILGFGSTIDALTLTLRPGALVRDVAILLLPLWVLALVLTTHRSANMPLLQIEHDDRAVAELLVAGHTYKEISDALTIGPNAAKVAVARLYRRLGARNRGEAVNLIVQNQLLDDRSRTE